jgi:hypothetical protein
MTWIIFSQKWSYLISMTWNIGLTGHNNHKMRCFQSSLTTNDELQYYGFDDLHNFQFKTVSTPTSSVDWYSTRAVASPTASSIPKTEKVAKNVDLTNVYWPVWKQHGFARKPRVTFHCMITFVNLGNFFIKSCKKCCFNKCLQAGMKATWVCLETKGRVTKVSFLGNLGENSIKFVAKKCRFKRCWDESNLCLRLFQYMIFSLGIWGKIKKIGKNWKRLEKIGKDWKTKKSLLPSKQLLDDVKNDDLFYNFTNCCGGLG